MSRFNPPSTMHSDNAVARSSIPTPLYVTQQGKGVLLKFKTQAEADAAWRMLAALAEAHANRTHADREDVEREKANMYRSTMKRLEEPKPKIEYLGKDEHGPGSEHAAWGCQCDLCMMR